MQENTGSIVRSPSSNCFSWPRTSAIIIRNCPVITSVPVALYSDK